MTPISSPINQFRVVAIAEGISFLVLLLIAMPLKYFADAPEMVRIVGAVHGGLFVLYLMTIIRAAPAGKWSSGRILEAIVSSLYPFGPFVFDRKLQRDAALQAAAQADA